ASAAASALRRAARHARVLADGFSSRVDDLELHFTGRTGEEVIEARAGRWKLRHVGPSHRGGEMHAIRRRRREEEHVRAVERFDGRASGRRRRADTLVGPYARPRLHRRADNVPPLLSVPPIPPLLLIRVISRTRTRTPRHARRDLPGRSD